MSEASFIHLKTSIEMIMKMWCGLLLHNYDIRRKQFDKQMNFSICVNTPCEYAALVWCDFHLELENPSAMFLSFIKRSASINALISSAKSKHSSIIILKCFPSFDSRFFLLANFAAIIHFMLSLYFKPSHWMPRSETHDHEGTMLLKSKSKREKKSTKNVIVLSSIERCVYSKDFPFNIIFILGISLVWMRMRMCVRV